MGKTPSRTYTLKCGEEIVAAMSVRWMSKKNRHLEIARFCPVMNTSVIGGFSKLIKFVKNIENPNKIVTFIDRRYGSGSYLKRLGWEKTSSHISFVWTNSIETAHRMNFPGNSGYDHGLYKVWDCGQDRWELLTR